MSNEEKALAIPEESSKMLAAFGGLEEFVTDLVESENDVRQEHQDEASGAVQYVTFKKAGMQGDLSPWEYGQEGIQIHPDSRWIVDILSMMHGWMGFEKGPGGKLIKGQHPDVVFTPFNKRFPDKDPGKPWMSQRAFKWRAMCISSPIEDQVGVLVENADYRGMKKGYAELEQAVAQRMKAALRAKHEGSEAQYAELVGAPCPVIRFRFKLGVQTSNGAHNQGIIEMTNEWSPPVIVETQDDATEAPDAPSIEDAVQQEPVADKPRRRRRED